ncbi:helix-turn-helix transcriptional regulator [Pseudomonas sp. CCI3.2]|uniref:helix-turn-helix domain-containing protein n=1 Tax=unclassified Pseudomonas TaxID=196821 RepID=UPI002B23390D|nr:MULTISPECIES: helix-turn-helix transcriptional regulator [unclassified Pseudomonas]MEB0078044.1 helix-turn-helix transcriptional regulator [Pseudomonas sp. MH10out]MEB0104051.1 helix-turn-helix transcriptional regulator [Pseudomonas sp. CCI3.2]
MEMVNYFPWEYSSFMSIERRQLEDWEKAECAALKAALADFNRAVPKEKRLTQEDVSHSLGMSQGTLSSHLNGHRALNVEMAAKMGVMLAIPVERFSERLAKEISDIAAAITGVSSELGGGQAPRVYQADLYEAAPSEQKADVDEIAEMMLRLSPEQARKLKQAMDLLMPSNDPRKD